MNRIHHDGTYVKESWTEKGQEALNAMTQPSPSCLKCSHFLVCKIAGNMFPMMEQMFPGKEKPFKPDEIAKLCVLYEHKLEEEDEQ